MRKVKKLFFYTPPLQNHYFWGAVEAEMARKSGLKQFSERLILMSDNNVRSGGMGCGLGGVAAVGWSKNRGAGLDRTLRIEFRSIGVFKSGG